MLFANHYSTAELFIARFGLKDQLDKLVDHPSPTIRANIAAHGWLDHLERLKTDPNPVVQYGIQIGQKKTVGQTIRAIDRSINRSEKSGIEWVRNA